MLTRPRVSSPSPARLERLWPCLDVLAPLDVPLRRSFVKGSPAVGARDESVVNGAPHGASSRAIPPHGGHVLPPRRHHGRPELLALDLPLGLGGGLGSDGPVIVKLSALGCSPGAPQARLSRVVPRVNPVGGVRRVFQAGQPSVLGAEFGLFDLKTFSQIFLCFSSALGLKVLLQVEQLHSAPEGSSGPLTSPGTSLAVKRS